MDDQKIKETILMYMEEIKNAQVKIDMQNKDIERKGSIILGLFNIIQKTGNIEMIAEAGEVMKANA